MRQVALHNTKLTTCRHNHRITTAPGSAAGHPQACALQFPTQKHRHGNLAETRRSQAPPLACSSPGVPAAARSSSARHGSRQAPCPSFDGMCTLTPCHSSGLTFKRAHEASGQVPLLPSRPRQSLSSTRHASKASRSHPSSSSSISLMMERHSIMHRVPHAADQWHRLLCSYASRFQLSSGSTLYESFTQLVAGTNLLQQC